MRVTGQVQREAWLAGRLPPVEQVRPGTWSLPVPIPDNPLRYTLTYVLEAGSGLLVVDPGWHLDSSWLALVEGLAIVGASPSDVTGIVVTHVHADHHGLSGRLREVSGAWVGMHPDERDALPARQFARSDATTDERWLRACGLPDDVITELAMSRDRMAPFLALAEPDLLLADGDLVPVRGRALRAVWTPGHTPGHLCFHDEEHDLLLSGDHVLPRISPNIGLSPQLDGQPLADYLSSLERVTRYDSAEILPAHEYRFAGLAHRVRVLAQHHEHRCAEILAALERLGPATGWQITQEISWSRGWQNVTGMMRRAAVAETAAHLRHLVDSGRVVSRSDGSDNLPRYAPAPGPAAGDARNTCA